MAETSKLVLSGAEGSIIDQPEKIDPAISALGKEIHPNHPYSDPRVRIFDLLQVTVFVSVFALLLAMPVALGIFAALGLGMALPFLVLTWAPALLDRLPAPGPWMETVRQALAFPLYGTALWLLWVLGHQTDIDRVLVAALGMLVVALALWLAARRPRPVRIAAMAVLLAGLALPALWVPERPGDRVWEPFAQARLDQLRAAGVPVFVNLTADWCITCLANERIALSSPRFRAALAQGGIRYLKGDWTRYDPEITALLRAHGRSGVPLYLFFRPHQEAQILPQLLTEQTVLEAVDAAPPPRG